MDEESALRSRVVQQKSYNICKYSMAQAVLLFLGIGHESIQKRL